MKDEQAIQYNKAKNWEVVLFATKDIVPNVFMFLMNFISYLAVGYYGVLVNVVGLIVTSSRLLDGVTDPIIGVMVDKIDSKFGRYRPMMILGYLLLAGSIYAMFFIGVGSNVVVFTLIYIVYIIGYTFFVTASNGARTVLTNEPKQRAANGRWTGIFIILLSTAFSSLYIAKYIVPKYGRFELPVLQEMSMTAIIIAGIFTVLSCIAIASKDKPEFYSSISTESIRFTEVFKIFKENKPLRAVILAASSDKLAMLTFANSSIGIMVWGIIVGNYSFYGTLGLISLIPMILIIFFGMKVAGNIGFKRTIVLSSWTSIIASLILFIFFAINPTAIGSNWIYTIPFIIVYCIMNGAKQIGTSAIYPMISDVSDYEMYRTQKFVPGTISAVYTFIDKLISSLSATIVAFLLSLIGFTDTLPQVGDERTPQIFMMAMFVMIGLPVIGWLCSILGMNFYELDTEKMKEIQRVNNTNREKQVSMKK